MADVGLRALHYSHLEVYGVADDVHFSRLQVIEQVTAVPILVPDGILILRKPLVHVLLIVHVAFLHS